MSRIENAKGRIDGNSGYTRAMGNNELGQLLSRVQSTVISNGNELEDMIADRALSVEDIDEFIDQAINRKKANGTYLCRKKVLRKTKKYKKDVEGIEPDMIIFIVQDFNVCKVIELKDGDTFDTKKVKGEKENLKNFALKFGSKIPFSTDYFICCFNQNDKKAIYEGLKKTFELEHILTGPEFCEILDIDYDEIRKIREKDAKDNFEYFIDELLKISEVAEQIKKRI